MNIEEYIESGIIESCLLGLATQVERQEFEALCIQYPQIIEARRTFEKAIEDQLMKEAVNPPPIIKEKILQSLNIPGTTGLYKMEKEHKTSTPKMNVWKWVAAAGILLLAGSAYWGYSVNNKYKKLLESNIEIANQPDHSSHADAINALKTIVQKPTIKWSIMVEPANSSHCMAHIYWDSLSKNTFLLLGNIPQPLSGKQFQLWAMAGKHPVDLGIFDVKKEGQLLQMKNINDAKSFAITIEPIGGSTAPTLKSTYAVGEL